jgi:hypothetical protein
MLRHVDFLKELEGTDDNEKKMEALKKMYQGDFDFSEKGLGKYTPSINADTLMGIANEDPEQAMELAKNALRVAGLNEDQAADLVASSRKLREFDKGRTFDKIGQKRITVEDMLKASFQRSIHDMEELRLAPFRREAGEKAWSRLEISAVQDAGLQAKLADLSALAGGKDLSLLTPDKMEAAMAIISKGDATGKHMELLKAAISKLHENMEQMNSIPPEGGKAMMEGLTSALSSLNIEGIIKGLAALTNALSDASKNP